MKTVLTVLFMLMFSVVGLAQEPAAPQGEKTEIQRLQEQIAALIKARGEDQKANNELKNQIAALNARLPLQEPEDVSKKNLESLEVTCKTFNMKVGSVSMKLNEKQQRVLEGFTCIR